MQVQIALVILFVDFRQYTSLISDHLILSEVRFGIFPVVARDAVTVQYRLYFQTESERTDTSFRCLESACLLGRSNRAFRNGYAVLVLMATDTRDDLARHTRQPATHPLDSSPVFIQRLDGNRRVGWNGEQCGTIFLDRNRSEHALDIPSALYSLCIMVGRS